MKLRVGDGSMDLPGVIDTTAIVLSWLIACWPWLNGTHYVTGDSLGFFFPQSHSVVASILRGDAPWWNPLAFGGQPLLGDPQSTIFTPHTLTGLLAGSGYNIHLFDITTLIPLLFGGLAVQRLGASESDRRVLPIIGAIVFMLGGAASARLQHVVEILSYSLLPLQVLAIKRACRDPNFRSAALLALALLAGLLNPNQVVYLSALGLAPFFLLFASASSNPGRAVLTCVCSTAAASVVALPVLASIAEFIAISTRAVLPVAASASESLPFFDLVSIAVPGLFGVLTARHGVWAPTDASQDTLYIGLIPVGIALLVFLRLGRAGALTRICAAMSVFWFLFAVGTHTPLYPALFAQLPGLADFKRPADGEFLMNFSIALLIATARFEWPLLPAGRPARAAMALAAAGLAAIVICAATQLGHYAGVTHHAADLIACYRQGALRLAIVVMALAVCWRGGSYPRRLVGPLLVCLTLVDMVTGGRYSPIFSCRYHLAAGDRFFGTYCQAVPLAVEASKTLDFLQAAGVTNKHSSERVEFLGGALSGNVPQTKSIATTSSYGAISLASFDRVIGAQFLQAWPKRFTAQAPDYDSEPYRRLGLRYVLFDIDTMAVTGPEANIVQRTARAVRERLASSGTATLSGKQGAYEVWEMKHFYAKAQLISDSGAQSACEILSYRNTEIRVRCDASGPSNLVIGDNYAPGWQACVNGSPAPMSIYRNLFMQVPVMAGAATVVLHYWPIPFWRPILCEPAAPPSAADTVSRG